MAVTPPKSPPSAHQHGQPPLTGVLLCNLGTPEAPTPAAVRRYLAEFLSDPRVVEIPRMLWLPLLYGLILPLRSAKSAAKYATIWTPEGSPLKLWTERQAKRLQGWLAIAHGVGDPHAVALLAQPALQALGLPLGPQLER